MSTTLQSLIQECAGKVGMFGGSYAPSSGTSTTIFTMAGDSSPFDSSDDSTLMEDVWVKVESDTAGTPLNVGEVRRIKTFTPSSSLVTLARAFSNTPTTTQTMGFYFAIPPTTRWRNLNGWTYYINRALESLRYRRLGLLSLVTDGDMETSGVSNWTAVGGPTVSKVTTAANVTLGTQSLRVLNSGANGYARSANINVAPNDVYYVRADVRVASSGGTAQLIAYDQTNSAEIQSETSEYWDWRTAHFNFRIPSGCNQITIRLSGVDTDADVYWDNVVLHSTRTLQFDLPAWIDAPNKLETLYVYRGWYSQDNKTALGSHTLVPTTFRGIQYSQEAASPMKINLCKAPLEDTILLVEGLSRYTALTADSSGATADDSSTTNADKNLVVTLACALALQERGDKDAARLATDFVSRARTILPYKRGYIGGSG